ncbi:MAG: UDP-2,3-diacylglucosamine diphosphatase [Epsilonproteobacteria bacterium]|nr:UDP-2,3-diacylglucosamine diphosphatase [Campylobacterota bacterium]
MFPKIEEGALFVADAHLNENRDDFYRFLLFLEKGALAPSQLFLLGDIFDLLSFKIDYTKKLFLREIMLLRKLSKRFDIFYFEGNHDFLLKPLFKRMRVYSIKEQPVFFEYRDKLVAISHGDVFEGRSYMLYSKIIRNPYLLDFLNFIDKIGGYFLSKRILKNQALKNPCRKIENFEEFIAKRVHRYKKADLVVEGHHHQNKSFKIGDMEYVNLSSFACDRRVFELRKGKIKEFYYDKDAVFGS